MRIPACFGVWAVFMAHAAGVAAPRSTVYAPWRHSGCGRRPAWGQCPDLAAPGPDRSVIDTGPRWRSAQLRLRRPMANGKNCGVPRSARGFDWNDVVDFGAALTTLHYELQGDWYRDPWGWPELDWLAGDGRDLAISRLNAVGTRHVAKIDVPKENFGTRPAIVMDPIDRLIYQALVDRHSVKLIGSLRPFVFGWRLPASDPEPGKWSHNDLQHKAFRNTIEAAATFSAAALRTDIVSCFASIDLDRLCEMVEVRCGSGRVTDRLNDLVQGWGRVAGRSGLAQRSSASAALANMYLAPVDDILKKYVPATRRRAVKGLTFRTVSSIPRAARWMDDIWIFGRHAGALRRTQLEIQDVLRSISLEMNHAKTELLEGERVDREVKQVQHSAVEGALIGEPSDPQPLLELVEELLDDPSRADRTSVKFATRRLRDHEIFGPVPTFAAKAHLMPHAADALARLFRDSGYWRDLPSWYVEYADSPWAAIRWSVAQLGTAFPTTVGARAEERALQPVRDFLAKVLEGDPPLPLLALAAQRMAAWSKDDALSLFRELGERSDNPQFRRVVALAAIGAGEDRAAVRSLLGEFEENVVTARMLEERRFRVTTKADFDG